MHKVYKRQGAEIFISLNECSDYEHFFFPAGPLGQPGDGTVMVQMIPETISNHMKDKTAIINSQHGFMKGRSC